MSPEKTVLNIVATPARERLKAEIGERQLAAIEGGIGQPEPTAVEVVETRARARLRERIGEAELLRLEQDLIGRMDGEMPR